MSVRRPIFLPILLPILTLLLGPAAARAEGWPDLSTGPKAAAPASADAALLIAVENYATLPAVPGARQNFRDWYTFLTQTRGIPVGRVRVLTDHEGTREKMEALTRAASQDVEPGGTLWFVFIGHGAPARDGHGGILVGFDAQRDPESLYARSAAQNALLSTLGSGRQARTVAVIDACFSGRGTEGKPLLEGLQPVIAMKKDALPAETLILTAAAKEQFAGPLPGSRRPAFSYLMLGALRGWGDANADKQVTAEEALQYSANVLRVMLSGGRNQTPELQGSTKDSVLGQAFETGPDLGKLVIEFFGEGGGRDSNAGARERIIRSQRLVRQGRLADAEKELLAAEALAPELSNVRFSLAEIAEKRGDHATASQRYRSLASSADGGDRRALEQKAAELSLLAEDSVKQRVAGEQAAVARVRWWGSSLIAAGALSAGLGVFAAVKGGQTNAELRAGGFATAADLRSAAERGQTYNKLGWAAAGAATLLGALGLYLVF
jgi:hypothetical protein